MWWEQRAHRPAAPRSAALPTESCDLDVPAQARRRGAGPGPSDSNDLNTSGSRSVLSWAFAWAMGTGPGQCRGPPHPAASGGGGHQTGRSNSTPKCIWPISPSLESTPTPSMQKNGVNAKLTRLTTRRLRPGPGS